MSHTAMIGMGIKENWRNQGLGRCLIESVVDWAKEHSEIELIWLDVYASNELGYNLYKNMGFKVSGIINDFFMKRGIARHTHIEHGEIIFFPCIPWAQHPLVMEYSILVRYKPYS